MEGGGHVSVLALALAGQQQQPGAVGRRGGRHGALAGGGVREEPLDVLAEEGHGLLQQRADVAVQRLVLHSVGAVEDLPEGLVEVRPGVERDLSCEPLEVCPAVADGPGGESGEEGRRDGGLPRAPPCAAAGSPAGLAVRQSEPQLAVKPAEGNLVDQR